MNREHKYYVGDVITFRGVFKIDGDEQTPDADSAKAQIWSVDDSETAVQVEVAATISSNQIQYQYTTAEVGTFVIYLTAEFESGDDKRTGAIEFVVEAKKAY